MTLPCPGLTSGRLWRRVWFSAWLVSLVSWYQESHHVTQHNHLNKPAVNGYRVPVLPRVEQLNDGCHGCFEPDWAVVPGDRSSLTQSSPRNAPGLATGPFAKPGSPGELCVKDFALSQWDSASRCDICSQDHTESSTALVG